ncbi:uncharacterized protein LOC116771543 isoform X1 [Danaus plexippus]|uniref:uncharacterized protein LOC116771543 isoform X1 n=1 Tax=Danaus plexippus TaxID=13037 RepID=UPI002AB2F10E|nr:uncharacterized protein LOC116771543 isoform X1 [Danaus plexippus]
MEEKSFVWTSDLTKRFFQLRFDNEWLFRKKKQPWREFYKILLKSGFPEEMTLNHVRKKWSYTYDSYRIAKKTNNKQWKYFKIFDKHFGKTQVLDKYESWTDEWRHKLIICISEAKEIKLDFQHMWRTVENALRCQDLPLDCCIQDIKGLWHYIRMTFNRKYRLVMRNSIDSEDWPLYDPMLEYHTKYEPEYLERLSSMSAGGMAAIEFRLKHRPREKKKKDEADDEFQWSRDITESFIQIRMQNDWLFRDRKWAWSNLRQIMIEEYGFPHCLSSRDLSRKWAAIYAEYQKAKATNNISWMYYSLFEVYFGESSMSLNPLLGWQEEWVINLISTRTELEQLFKMWEKKKETPWREVEKKLRKMGIPLDHSLLEIEEIWRHLLKTFKWKQKFASKGILNEQWPYYEHVSRYVDQHEAKEANDGDFEDDVKLYELKKIAMEPKHEVTNVCRSCSSDDGCVKIFEETDDEGLDVAYKLKVIGGIEIQRSDTLPTQICLQCLQELENAFKFRRQCQEVDKNLRSSSSFIKVELQLDDKHHTNEICDGERQNYEIEMDRDGVTMATKKKTSPQMRPARKVIRRKKVRKSEYEYLKVCEVCGKHTRNLKAHMDVHSKDKCYSCEICEKKFKFKSGLIVHKATHNPTPKKTCEVCGKSFHILSQYRRHYAYHANERKYGCETCGKRFNSLDILKVHARIHTDERPFSCSECGKTFRTAGCVGRHKRIVHRNVGLQKI